MITVVAKIEAKAGREKEVREALLALIPITRQEDGCIQYDLHQYSQNHGQFLFYETWRDKASLDKHLASPHVQDLMKKADVLLSKAAEIKVYQKIS